MNRKGLDVYDTVETWRLVLLECFTRMHLALARSIRMQGLIFILKVTASLLQIIFSQSWHLYVKVFKNENTDIVLKCTWFVQPDKTIIPLK